MYQWFYACCKEAMNKWMLLECIKVELQMPIFCFLYYVSLKIRLKSILGNQNAIICHGNSALGHVLLLHLADLWVKSHLTSPSTELLKIPIHHQTYFVHCPLYKWPWSLSTGDPNLIYESDNTLWYLDLSGHKCGIWNVFVYLCWNVGFLFLAV